MVCSVGWLLGGRPHRRQNRHSRQKRQDQPDNHAPSHSEPGSHRSTSHRTRLTIAGRRLVLTVPPLEVHGQQGAGLGSASVTAPPVAIDAECRERRWHETFVHVSAKSVGIPSCSDRSTTEQHAHRLLRQSLRTSTGVALPTVKTSSPGVLLPSCPPASPSPTRVWAAPCWAFGRLCRAVVSVEEAHLRPGEGPWRAHSGRIRYWLGASRAP